MRKRSFFSILFVIAGVVAAGWISYLSLKESKRNRQIREEIESLQQEADNLSQNNQEMQEKIVYFETSEFQEKIAKEKLNLQKENENVAIIKPSPVLKDNRIAENKPTAQAGALSEKPNYKKWWDQFFKY